MQVVHIRESYEVYGGRPRGGKDPRSVKIGEHGWSGNPFRVRTEFERTDAIAQFKRYFWERINTDPAYQNAVRQLSDKRVACFCKPKACHLDVIAAWFEAGCPLRE